VERHRVVIFTLVLSAVSPSAPSFGRSAGAQVATAPTDTVRRRDSLAQQRERDRTRSRERLAQLLKEAHASHIAGDRLTESERLRFAGHEYLQVLDVPDSALALYQQAREVAHAAGNRFAELKAEYHIQFVQSIRFLPSRTDSIAPLGPIRLRTSRDDSASAFWHDALSSVRRAGDRITEAEVLGMISEFYQSYDSVLTYRKQQVEIARDLGERWEKGPATFFSVGWTYLRLARVDSAEVYLRESLRRARAKGNQALEGAALNELAGLNALRGHLDSALVLFQAAGERFQTSGDADGVTGAIYNVGLVQLGLGWPDSALFYFRRSRQRARESGNTFIEVNLLNEFGEAFLASGRPDSALAYFREALRMWPQVGERRTLASTLRGLGDAQHALGQADSALASLRRSLALELDLGTRNAAAGALGRIAKLHREAGNRDSALVNLHRGLVLARGAEALEEETALLGGLGELYYREGGRALGTAVAYYDSAAALRATLAARVGNDPVKVSYAELGTELYEHWVLAWLGREREVGREASYAAALAAAERGRAQALLDLLQRGQLGDAPNAAPGSGTTNAAGADLVQEGKDLIESVRAMATPTLAYATTKDTLLSWLILPSGEVTVDRQAVPRDSVVQLAEVIRGQLGVDAVLGRALRAIESRDPSAVAPHETRRSSTGRGEGELLARLAAPAAVVVPRSLFGRVPVGGELVVVPHGPLALLSFAALPAWPASVPGEGLETLGARYAIRYAPSLTTLRVVAARSKSGDSTSVGGRGTVGRGALVVGNPTMPTVRTPRGNVRLPVLPAAEREGQWVANALGTTPLSRRAATERAVRARMANAPVIHLATHGFAFSADARVLDSFVALAPDSVRDGAGNGLLTVGEMLEEGPRLTAELVVLSACQTGLGNLRQAEGTVGLQRAFLAKGARSVLVSLWSVSDEATELLMRRFYTHWLRDPDRPSKAEALRRAQADVRRTRGFSSPRFWAAFQLVGAQ
jgi:tetratricopeptide (TPR) repeat protein